MLFQIRHVCPGCSNPVDFAVSQISEVVRKEPDPDNPGEFRIEKKIQLHPRQQIDESDIREACAVSRCPLCSSPLLIVFRALSAVITDAMRMEREKGYGGLAYLRMVPKTTVSVVATYPVSDPPAAHPTWPEKIRTPFIDLQAMLKEKRHPSFIIGGCGTVLDVATKHLGAKNGTLEKRIDKLAEMNVVTGTLKDWAHALRLDRNAALHEFEGTQESALEMVEFIKLFLHVAFELPAAIAAKSGEEGAPIDGHPSDDPTDPPASALHG